MHVCVVNADSSVLHWLVNEELCAKEVPADRSKVSNTYFMPFRSDVGDNSSREGSTNGLYLVGSLNGGI